MQGRKGRKVRIKKTHLNWVPTPAGTGEPPYRSTPATRGKVRTGFQGPHPHLLPLAALPVKGTHRRLPARTGQLERPSRPATFERVLMFLWVSSEIFTSNNIFCLSNYTWPDSSVIQEHNLAPRAQAERTLSYISTLGLTWGGGISISFT